jgi:hypothetical protein
MRDKLQKVWQLFLSLFDFVEASVKRQLAKRCGENARSSYPKEPTREDLPQGPRARFGSFRLCRVPRAAWIAIFFAMMLAIPTINQAQTQQQTRLTGSEPVPEPAVPAILAAFDKYEVVAMPQGHGMQDLNDFILSLIRNPAFSEKVNDIEVEFGNSLYQPILDRYIAGENVPFTEVQKVWRQDGQPTPAASAFVEQFFPLVRALNQKLPPGRRLRVLAGDPPVDWDQIKSIDEIVRLVHREASIASVMEKEVLSKHRKALMLFGTFHLFHMNDVGGSAVSRYEKDYPNVTLVISELGIFDTDLPFLSDSKFVNWPIPALARAKGTWLGALDLSHFLPPPTRITEDCTVHNEFPKHLQKPMEDLVDAFLYLGPPDLRLREKIPADIALDSSYRAEFQRGAAMFGFPGAASKTSQEFDEQIVKSAEDPLFAIPKMQVQDPKDVQAWVQSCLDRKSRGKTSQ